MKTRVDLSHVDLNTHILLLRLTVEFRYYLYISIWSCGISTMGDPPPRQLFHKMLEQVPDIAGSIMHNYGEAHTFETTRKLMACSKGFRGNEALQALYNNKRIVLDNFFSERLSARQEVNSKQNLETCFEAMIAHKDKPWFFDAMQAMLNMSVLQFQFDAVSARREIIHTRVLLENYDWTQFRAHIAIYSDFHSILEVLVDYILKVVIDYTQKYLVNIVTQDGPASAGMTKQHYLNLKTRILNNMVDAGVVEYLWGVCKLHRTNVLLQTKMLALLYEMKSTSRSKVVVRNILYPAGNMLRLEAIVADTDIGLPDSEQHILFSQVARNYLWVLSEMLSTDPVFTPDEECRVVDAVHSFIARCFRIGDISPLIFYHLLYLVVYRVSTSTLRNLTRAQIDVLCDSYLVQQSNDNRRNVATLIYRAHAVNDMLDISGIDPMFML